MSTSQTLLSLAALMILGTVTLSADRVILSGSSTGYNSEAIVTGTAIGQAEIERITVKYFDGNVLPPYSTASANSFTAVSSLGPTESGVDPTNPATFVDVDDYNGYQYSDSTPRLGYFTIRDSVYYVDPDYPDQYSGTQEFVKRIDVRVSNQYIDTRSRSVVLSKLVSYRYKN